MVEFRYGQDRIYEGVSEWIHLIYVDVDLRRKTKICRRVWLQSLLPGLTLFCPQTPTKVRRWDEIHKHLKGLTKKTTVSVKDVEVCEQPGTFSVSTFLHEYCLICLFQTVPSSGSDHQMQPEV